MLGETFFPPLIMSEGGKMADQVNSEFSSQNSEWNRKTPESCLLTSTLIHDMCAQAHT